MPAKKKSCFQITSVTQAQVTASSITDDTESLDDPDESRTEDVSSEIFDVSRADFEPEVCDRSSSEETLNNVGGDSSEAHSAMALHIPQDGQLLPTVVSSGSANGGFGFRSSAVPSVAHIGGSHVLGASIPAVGQPASVPVGIVQQSAVPAVSAGGAVVNVTIGTSQQPLAPSSSSGTATSSATTTTTASCSSRFRVIKLDHGTGEPFRRGRWTCTEFYERESEGSVITRTVESIKPTSAVDQIPERDSGLGVAGSSVVAPAPISAQVLDPASISAESSGLTHTVLHPVDPQQQTYGIGHQPSSGAFQPPAYGGKPIAVAVPSQPQVQVSVQPAVPPQNLLPPGHNGVPASAPLPIQKSPSIPSAPAATQSQQFAYPVPSHHLPAVIPPSQATDYRQQQLRSAAATASVQTLSVASLPVGPPASQGPSPVMTPAATTGTQVLGLMVQAGEVATAVSLPGNQAPAPAQGLLQQAGSMAVPGTAGGTVAPHSVGTVPLQPLGLAGSAPVTTVPLVAPPGVQNVPTTVLPGPSSTPLTLPNQAQASPPAVGQPLQGPRSGSVAGLGFAPQVPPSTSAPVPVDENRRKSDALPQPSALPAKDVAKPLIPESLQLPAPSVNSLFGLPLSLDGDEDRDAFGKYRLPAGENYEAIQFMSSKIQQYPLAQQWRMGRKTAV
ncbi:hypothetical protein JZ751_025093 [Albula glossodonta]|uniref:TSC22 domain family protein 2 n=1 Tax=Albula glossodonta TaxID=121402 RepID=A0A8T2PM14_9TELE|nr:hypothetical protein JZ751_025093 [Albula glossodonta]